MATDLYSRNPTFKKYQDNLLEVTDEISLLVTQIENLFATSKKSVMGSLDMGMDLLDMLFTLNLTETEIISNISEQIYNYCPLAMEHDVDVQVQFFKGNAKDVAVIDIYINNSKAISVLL
jgi:hypothetical protein